MSEHVLRSTRFYFDKNEFYNDLPQNLKHKLVLNVLVEQKNLLKYFFNDFEFNQMAPQAFVVGVLTNLDSSIYEPCQVIIPTQSKVKELIFIAQGKCRLFGFFKNTVDGLEETYKINVLKLRE